MDEINSAVKTKDLSESVPIKPLFFKSSFSKCRVSCVKCFLQYIFAGVGDILHIYNIHSQKLEFKKQILEGQNIYGIAFLKKKFKDPDKVIIWGGKDLCLATITLVPCADVFDTEIWHDNVWIWDVVWFDVESFVTVGMNNSVTLWNCCTKSKECVAHCEDQCILYSGKIIGDSWDSCIVLAGTVMQNILIWKPQNLVCPTLHSLKGHKGAVFSVNFCPVSNFIVSTSDDRSVRFWKVIFKAEKNWTTATVSLISSIFGHTARVWQSVILNGPKGQKIVSVGEDGVLCLWTLSGENMMRREAHQGGSICSVDANVSAGLIVTGGMDGGLCQWSLQSHHDFISKCISFDRNLCSSYTSETTVPSQHGVFFYCDANKSVILNDNSFKNIKKFNFISKCDSASNISETAVSSCSVEYLSAENPVKESALNSGLVSFSDTFKSSNLKSVVLIKTGNLVASLDNGFLLGCSPNDIKWKLLFYDDRFANYHLLSVSGSRRLISLASICGTILLFQDDSSEMTVKLTLIAEALICTSKIYSLHWLSDEFFITCISEGILEIWNVNVNSRNGVTDIKKHGECTLPSNKERWLTCASLSSSHLLCGDRSGSVHYYHLATKQKMPQTVKRIHHGGVCDVKWNMSKTEAYSVGRDGYLRHWIVKEETFQLLITEKLPIKWPTRVFLNHPLGIIVHGFTASQVLIWSYHERKILLTQECGGGHRSWDCVLKEALVLVWIKDKCAQFRSFPLDRLMKSVLIEGFHCKEINAFTSCQGFSENGKQVCFLLTGSEDTTLRVSSCSLSDVHSQSSFMEQFVFRSHISSIRALTSTLWTNRGNSCTDQTESLVTLQSKEIKYLIVSAGGRAQLKIWSFTTSFDKIDQLVELGSHMLRGNDKSRRLEKSDSIDPEARYMAVDVICLPENQFYVFTACSDAIIRIFGFNAKSMEISLEVEIDYHEACVLGIHLKELGKDITDEVFEFLMLTMTTEGTVAVWKLNISRESCKNLSSYNICSISKPLFVFSAHQSGINSHALKPLAGSFLLATGGDDTAVTLSHFSLDEKLLKRQFIFDNAHEAQVSGITFLRDNPWILSTSTDQRVILWAYSQDSKLRLQYIAEYQSIVADIHGLSLLDTNETMICVYGCGLEIISFDHEEVRDMLSKIDIDK